MLSKNITLFLSLFTYSIIQANGIAERTLPRLYTNQLTSVNGCQFYTIQLLDGIVHHMPASVLRFFAQETTPASPCIVPVRELEWSFIEQFVLLCADNNSTAIRIDLQKLNIAELARFITISFQLKIAALIECGVVELTDRLKDVNQNHLISNRTESELEKFKRDPHYLETLTFNNEITKKIVQLLLEDAILLSFYKNHVLNLDSQSRLALFIDGFFNDIKDLNTLLILLAAFNDFHKITTREKILITAHYRTKLLSLPPCFHPFFESIYRVDYSEYDHLEAHVPHNVQELPPQWIAGSVQNGLPDNWCALQPDDRSNKLNGQMLQPLEQPKPKRPLSALLTSNTANGYTVTQDGKKHTDTAGEVSVTKNDSNEHIQSTLPGNADNSYDLSQAPLLAAAAGSLVPSSAAVSQGGTVRASAYSQAAAAARAAAAVGDFASTQKLPALAAVLPHASFELPRRTLHQILQEPICYPQIPEYRSIALNFLMYIASIADSVKKASTEYFTDKIDTITSIMHCNNESITAFCIDAQGKMLACATKDGILRIFDRASGAELVKWCAHNGIIYPLRFNRAGDMLISSSLDAVKIWQINATSDSRLLHVECICRFSVPSLPTALTLDSNNNVYIGTLDGSIYTVFLPNIDTLSGKKMHQTFITDISVNADNSLLISADNESTVIISRTADLEPIEIGQQRSFYPWKVTFNGANSNEVIIFHGQGYCIFKRSEQILRQLRDRQLLLCPWIITFGTRESRKVIFASENNTINFAVLNINK